jgi:hypothetical protein
MNKNILILTLFASFVFFSCNKNINSAEENNLNENEIVEEVNEPSDVRRVILRSDGFYPGIASEWLYVSYSFDEGKILQVQYKNTQNENLVDCELKDIEFLDGDAFTVFQGTITIMGSDYDFSYITNSDEFNLTIDEDRTQTYEAEMEY